MARWLAFVALAGLLSTSEVVRDKAQIENTRRAEQRWFLRLKEGMQAMCNLQRGWGVWNSEGASGHGSCEGEPADSWHVSSGRGRGFYQLQPFHGAATQYNIGTIEAAP